MFTVLAFITSFSAVVMLLMGILSFLRDPTKQEHRWFFALTLALAIWVPANFIDSNVMNPAITLPLVKVDFSVALLIMWLLLQFVVSLIGSGSIHNIRQAPYLVETRIFRLVTSIFNATLIVAILTNQLLQATLSHGTLTITTPPVFIVYVAAIALYFIYALMILGNAYLKSSHGKRQGLDLIWIGFFLAVTANIMTNLVFPSLIHTRSIVQELNIIGYMGILGLVICMYIAITTRKLFDIRLVVARSLAYTLLILFIGILYASLMTVLSVVISGVRPNPTLIVTSLVMAFVTAITFQYVHAFFTNATSHIFFRDSYEPQAVLKELNSIITATMDLNTLIKNSDILLKRTTKSSFCVFVLVDEGGKYRTFNSQKSVEGLHEISPDIEKVLSPQHPIITEYLENHEHLKTKLSRMRIELIIPMYANETAIGFIVFGTKQNGVVYSQQDIELLTLVADSLSVAVQNALMFEEIKSFNRTLQQKVTHATRELRESNEKLTALDEAKDDFISMASHQLRTPLTSVKGYTSMVLEGDAGKLTPMQKKLLTQSFFSAQRMVYLIADLLNVSRIRTGKFVMEPIPLNLADLVAQEVEQLQDTAASRALTLTYKKPRDFPELMIDETKIRQVIMNFIDNAIYYTPSGGHITVEVENKPSTVELRVTDEGIGVPKSEQAHLFTKFYRAPNARKARPDGTGLGLFMAKKVVIAQGGVLIFRSRENEGSTFGFILSKAKLAVPKPAKA